MRGAIFLALLAGCGVLGGSNDQAPIATLHLHIAVPLDENVQPPAALVWYAGAASFIVSDDTMRITTVDDFDIDLVALPPTATLVTIGARRVALGQLVFYAGGEGAPALDANETIVGAPIDAQLLYLEGPAVDADEADPASLLVAGTQPGFNWLSVPAGSSCAPVALPIATPTDFAFVPGDPTKATPLCDAAANVPACSTTPGPTLPSCP